MNFKQIRQYLNERSEEVFQKLDIKYELFGDNMYSTCPVHEASDNPRAFSFSKKRGIWKCWTRECQENLRNDIFGLIQGVLKHNAQSHEFSDVLSWIKKNFNIDSSIVVENNEEDENEFSNIIKYLSEDVVFPKYNTVDISINYDIPSKYFLSRGFSPKTLEYFEVGDCNDRSSNLYDRAIIPIYSDCGQHKVAYIARAIKEYKLPKFLIHPKGFDKRFHLYNLHKALPYIKESNTLFIVEGQGDVWKLYESGIYNAVGIFGRTLTKEQQKRLQKLPITHLVILTDNDQAGRESKIQLQRQLGRFYKLSFPYLQHKDIGDMTDKQIKTSILSQIRG
jgi:DNA primase